MHARTVTQFPYPDQVTIEQEFFFLCNRVTLLTSYCGHQLIYSETTEEATCNIYRRKKKDICTQQET